MDTAHSLQSFGRGPRAPEVAVLAPAPTVDKPKICSGVSCPIWEPTWLVDLLVSSMQHETVSRVLPSASVVTGMARR